MAILDIFERFLDSLDSDMEDWEIMEELMSLRADFAIHHAIKGFGMDWDEALDLVAADRDTLTPEEQTRRDIIVAAIDNLVDFAVAEEYQMAEDVIDMREEERDMDSEERRALMVDVCKKYNETWATTENLDIEYAMMIADALVVIPADTSLMYMTQGDERVRPWHLQYEGFTCPKSRFPAWLIPPIEHQCRCYLVEVEDAEFKLSDIQNRAVEIPEKPEWFNPTFKESVALGGKIFSEDHPYFQIEESMVGVIRDIAERIKEKYLNG